MELPKEIWLQIGYGDEGSTTWADHKTGEWEEEVGPYVPQSSLTTARAAIRDLAEALKKVMGDFHCYQDTWKADDASQPRSIQSARSALARHKDEIERANGTPTPR